MARLLQDGDRIDKYQVERCLGVGGMGEVYLVSHVFLNVQRALKILRLDLTEDDPTFRDRFVREARIAARFQHPNSIGVVDVESESESGFLYLVMEYVDGQSLHQFLQNGVLEEKQMLYICREVARALDAAWQEMQLVHRDIKPGNIMIANDGSVKLADLGIAKSARDESGMTMTLTMEGTMIGTPEYASPEQCRDASHVDTRADIYSLGATMYEMLTGVRPFQGKNAFDTVAKVLQEPLVPVRQRNPAISWQTAGLIERMMSKDPGARPQTMSELIRLLDPMITADQEYRLAPSASNDMIVPVSTVETMIRKQAEEAASQITIVHSRKLKRKQWYDFVLLILIGILTLVIGGLNIYDFIEHGRQKSLIRKEYAEKIKAEEDAAAKKRKLGLELIKKPGIILNASGTSLLHYNPQNPQTEYTVPDGIVYIAPYAFENCVNLQHVILPDSVRNVGDGVFTGCHNLKTVSAGSYCSFSYKVIPEKVRLIRRTVRR